VTRFVRPLENSSLKQFASDRNVPFPRVSLQRSTAGVSDIKARDIEIFRMRLDRVETELEDFGADEARDDGNQRDPEFEFAVCLFVRRPRAFSENVVREDEVEFRRTEGLSKVCSRRDLRIEAAGNRRFDQSGVLFAAACGGNSSTVHSGGDLPLHPPSAKPRLAAGNLGDRLTFTGRHRTIMPTLLAWAHPIRKYLIAFALYSSGQIVHSSRMLVSSVLRLRVQFHVNRPPSEDRRRLLRLRQFGAHQVLVDLRQFGVQGVEVVDDAGDCFQFQGANRLVAVTTGDDVERVERSCAAMMNRWTDRHWIQQPDRLYGRSDVSDFLRVHTPGGAGRVDRSYFAAIDRPDDVLAA
jgi:hypothetical protein